MTTEEYRNDMLYHAALSIGKTMLEKGLISEEEYAEMDTVLLQKYQPYMGILLSDNACYSSAASPRPMAFFSRAMGL